MDDDNDARQVCLMMLTAAACILLKMQVNNRRRRRPRWWIRPIYRRQRLHSDYYHLYRELRAEDAESFFNYTRMDKGLFDQLLSVVGPRLKKNSNRPSIPAECRLLVTLRLLASGDSLQTIAFAFRMGRTTVCNIFRETCAVLWEMLQPIYIPEPSEQQWLDISKEFLMQWQLPNCIGAIDGKHINMKHPNKSGSLYFDYMKHFYLLGVCDANYKFIIVDIGTYDLESDGGVLWESQFGKSLCENTLDIPPNQVLPGTNQMFPHFFIGDEAFPLRSDLLKPYAGKDLAENLRVYNYRLSRATRCIENAFGILASRWQIFHKTIHAFPENVDKIVQATTCLHNYIMVHQGEPHQGMYCNSQYIDRETGTGTMRGQWRDELPHDQAFQPMRRRLGARNARQNALLCREQYMRYVNNEGSVHPA